MRLIHSLLITALLATQTVAAQSDADYIIRAYEVPVEQQVVIEAVLGEAVSLALGLEQRRRGVSSPGPGQILVTAPQRIHSDIERFLQDFQPAEVPNLRTRYWIVRGTPSVTASLPAELAPISEVLATISAASVDMSFSLEDQVEILSRAGGNGATASIRNGLLSQEFAYVGGKIVGEFLLQYRNGSQRPDRYGGSRRRQAPVAPGAGQAAGRTEADLDAL